MLWNTLYTPERDESFRRWNNYYRALTRWPQQFVEADVPASSDTETRIVSEVRRERDRKRQKERDKKRPL